jgi:hypothetical protein
LDHETLAEIDVPGPYAFSSDPTAGHDFRTHFIAIAADPDATMHYDV